MPDERRPQPVRLNAAPRTTSRPPPKSKKPRRPRKSAPDDSSLLYWIAGGLVLLLIAFAVVYIETPEIKTWLAAPEIPEEPLPTNPVPPEAVKPPPAPPQPTAEEIRLKKLKEKAALEAQHLVERPAPQLTLVPAPVPPPPVIPPSQPPPLSATPPPLVQPAPSSTAHVAPARALPVDMNKLDTERIAAYQVALERIHFSCGFIDGDQGMRTQRMLRAYQASRGLPATGFLDPATRDAIGEPGEPFLTYTVKADDIAAIMPKPQSWREKAKATRLGYNEIWELLAEKFHCTRAYLKALNRGITTPVAGTEIIGPKVFPAAPIPHAASLRINLGETSIEALDASGRVIAFFPCSIAKDKNKRPHGLLTVKVVDPNPDYTFDPALFVDASKAENITHKLTLPPGPRNPVGTTWVGLSLPGYGIHGTPEPENISRTQSHGCFRLANWNAEKVIKMVKVGTPVDVQP
jgi:lipoprotein-anchoring transpeptidase ErfK/SrfK